MTKFDDVMDKFCNGKVVDPVVVIHPIERYFESNVKQLKKLTDRKLSGVFVSFQRPYDSLVKSLKEQKVNVKNLAFIDLTPLEEKESSNENCIYLTPDVNVKIICKSILKLLRSRRFVFVDSLSTMSLYNSKEELEEFVKYAHDCSCDKKILVVLNMIPDMTKEELLSYVGSFTKINIK